MKKSNRNPSRLRSERCVICRTKFFTRHSQGKYCSTPCRKQGERASWVLYGRRNRDKRSDYHRSYYLKNRNQIIARTIDHHKTEAGKLARKKNYQWALVNAPHKIFARGIVLAAIRAGYLKRGNCETCGKENADAHHEDYMEPLKVIWLCRIHHSQLHMKRRNNEKSNQEVAGAG